MRRPSELERLPVDELKRVLAPPTWLVFFSACLTVVFALFSFAQGFEILGWIFVAFGLLEGARGALRVLPPRRSWVMFGLRVARTAFAYAAFVLCVYGITSTIPLTDPRISLIAVLLLFMARPLFSPIYRSYWHWRRTRDS